MRNGREERGKQRERANGLLAVSVIGNISTVGVADAADVQGQPAIFGTYREHCSERLSLGSDDETWYRPAAGRSLRIPALYVTWKSSTVSRYCRMH
jgi:hypothetical protein